MPHLKRPTRECTQLSSAKCVELAGLRADGGVLCVAVIALGEELASAVASLPPGEAFQHLTVGLGGAL